jgi:hypothetical protein
MFRQPSMLRNSIYPLATRLKSRIKAASSVGSDQFSPQVLLDSSTWLYDESE